jgi:transcriptional regulator with XRE-family HTH domain
MVDIGARLREFRIRSYIKMPAIAAATGIAKETLYKWEKGTKPSNIHDYFTLKNYLDKMEGRLEVEAYELENRKPATLRLPFNPNRLPIPQTEGKAAAGAVISTETGPELIVDRINSPCLGMAEGLIEVIGDSMAPTLINGCRIVIARLKNDRLLNWGNCYYIIDHNWQGNVRRVYRGQTGNNIQLIADNPNQLKFPPLERTWDEIAAIFKIIASINKH